MESVLVENCNSFSGMKRFKGDSFHTSRWDYSKDLRGKRVAVIGTGATASQVPKC